MDKSKDKTQREQLQEFFGSMMKDALSELTEEQRILLELVAYRMWDSGYKHGVEVGAGHFGFID